MRQAALCFLIQEKPVKQLLLGYKKAGFGAGKFSGIGGKVEAGESVETAVIREVAEEISIHIF